MLTPTCGDPGLGMPTHFHQQPLQPAVPTSHMGAPGVGMGAGSPPSLPSRSCDPAGAVEERPLRARPLKASPIVGGAAPGERSPAGTEPELQILPLVPESSARRS